MLADLPIDVHACCVVTSGVFIVIPIVAVLVGIYRSTRPIPRYDPNPSPRCPSCGYDLRATPDRCPECGTILKGADDVSN